MKNKITLAIAVLVLIASLYLLYATYRTVEDRTIQQLNAEQTIHARQAILSIQSIFHHDLQFLSSLAGNPHIRDLDDQGRTLMDQYLEGHSEDISAVTRISADGNIVYTAPLVPEALGKNVLHQKHNLPHIFRSNAPVISDVFVAVQGYPAVAVHVPIMHEGTFYGRLSILLPFKGIAKKYLSNVKIGKTGHAWLVGRDGTLLYHPDESYVGRIASEVFRDSPEVLALSAKMQKGRSGTAKYTYQGRLINTVYYPIELGTTLWGLAVSTPQEEVLAITEDFRNQWIIILVLMLLAFAMYGYGSFRDQAALARRADELAMANESLRKALDEVKTLTGLLPICASCHKIRNDSGYWEKVESYVEKHSHAQFSHSLCPDCSDKLYGDQDWYQELKAGRNDPDKH